MFSFRLLCGKLPEGRCDNVDTPALEENQIVGHLADGVLFQRDVKAYFLAVAEMARMFWSVISMLETLVLCFINYRRVCLPW